MKKFPISNFLLAVGVLHQQRIVKSAGEERRQAAKFDKIKKQPLDFRG